MDAIQDFARRVCADGEKSKNVKAFLDNCRMTLPVTVYMGKRILLVPEQIYELTCGEVDLICANSNADEEYSYIAIRHKVLVSKKHFLHFNPFKSIWVEGKAHNNQEYDPRYIFDFNCRPTSIMMGAREINYRTVPIEIKMQFGVLFNGREDEINHMSGLIEELQSEIEENDKTFYEVGY